MIMGLTDGGFGDGRERQVS